METYEIKNGVGVIPEGTTIVRTNVFRGRTDLKSVGIPASVKHIDAGVFLGCTNLEIVKLPKGVVCLEFYGRAFTITRDPSDCSLDELTKYGLSVKLLRKEDLLRWE